MRNLLRGAFLSLGLMTLAAAPASAFTVVFDQNGDCTGCTGWTYAPDPTGGFAGDVLTYELPQNVVDGDVNIAAPDGVTIADMLRFYDGDDGNSYMIFYAYNDLGNLASVGDINITPDAFIGTLADAKGTFTYDVGNVYIGLGAVPEPSTWALMGLGFAGLGFAAYRTKKTARAVLA